MKRFLIILVSLLLLVGCASSKSSIDNKPKQDKDVKIYLIGADGIEYPIQRFNYDNNIYIIYKGYMFQLK